MCFEAARKLTLIVPIISQAIDPLVYSDWKVTKVTKADL